MALPSPALDSFCVTIFETKTRPLDSYNIIARPEIMTFAVNVKRYARTVFENALAGGRITQEQFDQMAAMPNFPSGISVTEDITGEEE